MPERETKPLFVRLTAAERRRIRTLAVSQGLTMREAIMQAFAAWASQLRSGALTAGAKRGSSAGVEVAASRRSAGAPAKRRQSEQAPTGQQGRRPADARPNDVGPSLAGGAPLPGFESLAGDWVSHAAQLDWSKCPAAESVQTKRGSIWVAAGTLAPLADIFEAVAGGNPLPEIAEVYELTLEQLTTLLQFAAGGAGGSASGG